MLKPKMRWSVAQTDREQAKQFAQDIGTTPLVASLLQNRGITEAAKAKAFLYDEGVSFHDPFQLKDMDKAVARLQQAKAQQEPVLVFGDYDAGATRF